MRNCLLPGRVQPTMRRTRLVPLSDLSGLAVAASCCWRVSTWRLDLLRGQHGCPATPGPSLVLSGSFWSTMQRELLDIRTWDSTEQLSAAIFEWVEA